MATVPELKSRDRNGEGRPENARPRDRLGRPLPPGPSDVPLADAHVPESLDHALMLGVALWDEQRFFEAHELLELVWHAASEHDRDFWQGVIQVAVGCTHHQRGNLAGAVGLLDRARARLTEYPDVYLGVDVEQMRVFCDGAIAAMQQAGFTVEIVYPLFPAMDGGPWLEQPSDDAGRHPMRTS